MQNLSESQIIALFQKDLSLVYPQLLMKELKADRRGYKVRIVIEGKLFPFALFVCRYPNPTQIRALVEQSQITPSAALFIASYFPPNTQEFLVEKSINFLDLSGNCFFNLDDRTGNKRQKIQLRITGKKNRYVQKDVLQNIFQGKSARLIRTMLETYPKKWAALQLSEACSVSPALVTKVVSALEVEGYASKQKRKGGGIAILDPQLLLDRWADNYRYKHSLQRRVFVRKPVQEIVASLAQQQSLVVTRAAAASLVAPHANYDVIDLYQKGEDFLFEGVDVDRGENVRIWTPTDVGVFDFLQEIDGIPLVGNIQLYLDLYSDPKRGKEQANFLREKLIKF